MRHLIGLGRLAFVWVSLLPLGCSSGVEEAPESVDSAQQPLLQNPGPAYTTAAQFGWCGAGGASLPSGPCHPGFSFNSAGGAITASRINVGVYGVHFAGLTHGGNAQVVAQGSNAHCAITQVAPQNGGEFMQIACRAPSGALVDTRYMVSYYRDTNISGVLGGYALVRNTSPLSLVDTWNSTGSAVSVSSSGGGSYRVVFPGQVLGADTVQVTAVTGSNVYCKAANWSSVGSGVAVDVRCFNFNGSPQNSDFSISYSRNLRGEVRNTLPTGTQGGYSVVTSTGVVNPSFSKNTCPTGNNTVFQSGVGTYVDRIAGLGATQGERPALGLVTALGWDNNYCNLTTVPFHQIQAPSIVQVSCFGAAGQPANTQHIVMFELQDIGGC
jgi:hypothetical protein